MFSTPHWSTVGKCSKGKSIDFCNRNEQRFCFSYYYSKLENAFLMKPFCPVWKFSNVLRFSMLRNHAPAWLNPKQTECTFLVHNFTFWTVYQSCTQTGRNYIFGCHSGSAGLFLAHEKNDETRWVISPKRGKIIEVALKISLTSLLL